MLQSETRRPRNTESNVKNMAGNEVEIWLRMYEEQVRHGRHHETLRSQSTNIVIAISAALLAFVSSPTLESNQNILIGLFIVVINIYGVLMSLKHYERSRLHVRVGGKYRNTISDMSKIGDMAINEARKEGHDSHQSHFPLVRKFRAYQLWIGLHVVLGLIGLFVCFF